MFTCGAGAGVAGGGGRIDRWAGRGRGGRGGRGAAVLFGAASARSSQSRSAARRSVSAGARRRRRASRRPPPARPCPRQQRARAPPLAPPESFARAQSRPPRPRCAPAGPAAAPATPLSVGAPDRQHSAGSTLRGLRPSEPYPHNAHGPRLARHPLHRDLRLYTCPAAAAREKGTAPAPPFDPFRSPTKRLPD